MSDDAQAHDDAWSAGAAYDQYMGRWSRAIAPLFLDWLAAPASRRWLDVGCGTGALSQAIVHRCKPTTLCGIDPSEGFLEQARRNVSDARATFVVGDAQALGLADGEVDVAVSGLMLNFLADRAKALREMRRVVRPDGPIGFYVWDYPGGGVEFMHAYWSAAVALDQNAVELSEALRFPFCNPAALLELAANCGLRNVECAALETSSVFTSFDDYWHPFTLGAGPAPSHCAGLDADAREQLRQRLHAALSARPDGPIAMGLRAWAIKAVG